MPSACAGWAFCRDVSGTPGYRCTMVYVAPRRLVGIPGFFRGSCRPAFGSVVVVDWPALLRPETGSALPPPLDYDS